MVKYQKQSYIRIKSYQSLSKSQFQRSHQPVVLTLPCSPYTHQPNLGSNFSFAVAPLYLWNWFVHELLKRLGDSDAWEPKFVVMCQEIPAVNRHRHCRHILATSYAFFGHSCIVLFFLFLLIFLFQWYRFYFSSLIKYIFPIFFVIMVCLFVFFF